MKRLVLKEMKLLSFKEEKAKRITFHPNITVIKGDNHTGKSSLIKSIYWAFGTEPKDIHPNWKAANAIVLVDFSIGKDDYSILRKERFFAVFDANKKVIATFNGITNGIGPFLAGLLDYKIVLNDKKGEALIPPPAYFFLPYYIDQDASWNNNWSGFDRLSQFSNWRNDIVNYHTGIRPNEYYEINASIRNHKKEISELETQRSISGNIMTKIDSQINDDVVSIDIEQFKKEIDELLVNYDALNKKGAELKQRIIELENHKLHIEEQITIVQRAMSELKLDLEYANEQTDSVECPTCGNIYENSFAERFAIAKDEDTCKDLLISLDGEWEEVRKQIVYEYKVYNENNIEANNIRSILSKKQGAIQLKDIILNEGKREMKSLMEKEVSKLSNDIYSHEQKIDGLKEELKAYEDRKRQKQIKDRYLNLMHSNLLKLDVLTMEEKSYKKITSKINESGSGKPRALLAYYYSILQVIKENTTSTFCPIIIDSPNQQDQEKSNLDNILSFIVENKPEDSQLILGLVEMENIEFDGETIILDKKHSLLRENEYPTISKEIKSLLAKCDE
jgi:DNA repair exonuclease SbcCD ATPase subunit